MEELVQKEEERMVSMEIDGDILTFSAQDWEEDF